MGDYMNKPETIHATEADIIREYQRIGNERSVAKIFDVHTNKVKAILKKAGIAKEKRMKEDELQSVGMKERDLL